MKAIKLCPSTIKEVSVYMRTVSKLSVNESLTLKGQTAIVTGAATGIGRAICKALAREGVNLVTVWHVTDIGETLEEAKKFGVKTLPVQADVSNKDHVKRIVNQAIKEFGKVQILVNCAGVMSLSPLENITLKEWNYELGVNLTGYFLLIQSIFPHMKENRYGKIVCIGSLAGEVGSLKASVAYAASKGGVHALVKSIAKIGARYGIYCNCIAPGIIKTRMTEGMGHPEDVPLLGRKGSPEEVAEAVVFLASPASNYINGAILYVDGGTIISGGMR